MNNAASGYSLEVKLGLPYEETLDRVAEALKGEGFGVLTKIDVKATMKEKLDADFRKYAILGACNPTLAHRALSTDLDIGLLLPCNVIVYETENGCVVKIVDPIVMMGVVSTPEIESVALEAKSRLERVAEKLRD